MIGENLVFKNKKMVVPEGEFDGQPATTEELNELRGLTDESGFVPRNPNKAVEYYERKRFNVLNRYNLSHAEALELFRYYNGKLLEKYSDNPEILDKKNKANKKETSINLGEKFEEFFKERMLLILKSEYYGLMPGLSVTTSKSFEKQFMGYSFNLTMTGIQENSGDGISEYDFSLVDKNSDKNFIGKIKADINNDNVSVSLLPDFNLDKKEKFDINYKIQEPEKVKALMGLTYLLRKPEFNNTLYGGGRNPQTENPLEDEMVTDVGKEVKSNVIPFRRRTVDDVSEAWDQSQELYNTLSDEMRKFIEDNLGITSFNVHHISFSNAKDGRWSETFQAYISDAGRVGTCSQDRAQIEALVNLAKTHGDKAVISVNGGWIPPELENEPAGRPKRPHIRRNGKVILVMGQEFNSEEHIRIKDLFNKKRDGKVLNKEEANQLQKFLDTYEIKNPFNITFEVEDSGGVHFASGAFHEGTEHKGGGQGGRYIIRPNKTVSR